MPIPALVIDDDRVTRALIERILGGIGFEIFTAADGEAGLEAAARFVPALIVTDLLLPKADGLAVCSRIRKDPRLSGAKILVVTGLKNPGVQREARSAGADAILEKPFQADVLIRAVRALIPGV
ncbi:MAG: response regulator [Candidatus Aminicenantes bacterium]|nr:response regulator [Candidatus Aminicenantes bacterium]